MKLVVVSDTHAQHQDLGVLSGDVLIHCGDGAFGRDASWGDVQRLDAWFSRQAFKLILCTGGNHDFALEEAAGRGLPTFRNAIYLEDSGVEFEGVKFYGAPWVPELRGWAYYQSGTSLKDRWAMIPEDADVLITHTPPYGILDETRQGRLCGCNDLRERVEKLRLRLHCFGHVHASAGMVQIGGTTYANASMADRNYKLVRSPIAVEL